MSSPTFQIFSSLRYDPSLPSLVNTSPPTSYNHTTPSPLYMLDLHRDRLLRAATHWDWSPAISTLSGPLGLQRLAAAIHQHLPTTTPPAPLRVRVAVSPDGSMDVTTSPVPETPLGNLFPSHLPPPSSPDDTNNTTPSKTNPYDILIADLTTPRSEFTHFKTTIRSVYDSARQRASITLTSTREVLLVNAADGSLMEGSTTTPYLWRDGGWVTPRVSRGFSEEEGSGGQDGTTRRWALERYVTYLCLGFVVLGSDGLTFVVLGGW